MERQRTPSAASLRVLEALLSQPLAERYGYELITTTGLQSGTLYPILMRLHDRGLVSAHWREARAPGKPPRQIYLLTPAGLDYAVAALAKAGQQSQPKTDPEEMSA